LYTCCGGCGCCSCCCGCWGGVICWDMAGKSEDGGVCGLERENGYKKRESEGKKKTTRKRKRGLKNCRVVSHAS
jgi:hypothetical protein